MIHHVSVGTSDLARARAFYDAVLPTVGLTLVKETATAADYGVNRYLFSIETPGEGRPASAANGVHIAFDAGYRGQVDAFHAAGLANGGRDAGAPGVRTAYDPNYYAAFLFDPDGNKVEAVTYSAK